MKFSLHLTFNGLAIRVIHQEQYKHIQ